MKCKLSPHPPPSELGSCSFFSTDSSVSVGVYQILLSQMKNFCLDSQYKKPHQIANIQFFPTMHMVYKPTSKTFSQEEKRVAFELWKVKVPLKDIRNQLKIWETALRRILTVANNNPNDPCPGRKPGSTEEEVQDLPEHPQGHEAILMNHPTTL